jgi:hypothetical protein
MQIQSVIRDLEAIPRALGQSDTDPFSRPIIRERVLRHRSESITGSPVVDSSDWEIVDERRWNEEWETRSGEVQRSGIEALAWYRSFHVDQDRWGIYIPRSSLAIMEQAFFREVPISRDRRIKLAWDILIAHEQMHFAIDCGCAWFEVLLGVPARSEFYARFGQPAPDYWLSRTEDYLEIEETAANIRVLRVLGNKYSKRIIKSVENFIKLQPRGYRDALKGFDDAVFRHVISETMTSYLATWIADRDVSLQSQSIDLDGIVPHVRNDILEQCPIYR